MRRLGGASERAPFYFSNFLKFLNEKISKIKIVFLVSDILEKSFRTIFFKISKSNQNLKVSSYFWKSCISKTELPFSKYQNQIRI